MAHKQILIVEDESIIAYDIKRSLEGMGYRVAAVSASGQDAIDKARELKPDLILMDVVLQGRINGIDAAVIIHSTLDIPVVYLTSYADDEIIEKINATEPYGYILKPFEERELHSVIEIALHKHAKDTELKTEQEWIPAAKKSIFEAVLLVDLDGRIKTANRSALSLTGCTMDEIVGKKAGMFLNDEADNSICSTVLSEIQDKKTVVCSNGNYRNKHGKNIPVRVTASLVNENESGYIVLIITDMTEQKMAMTAIEQAMEVDEIAKRTKYEFMANINHELRTPMNGISAMTDLLLETDLNDLQKKYLDIIRQSADAMMSIVNNILDFSETESGRVCSGNMDFNLTAVLDSAVRKFSFRAQEKDIHISTYIDNNVPVELTGDREHLLKIIEHLIDNAIKFTPKGNVQVSVKRNSVELPIADIVNGQSLSLHFSVTDSGSCISKDKLERIFESFTQADGSNTRKYGGTGLGLSIAGNLVKMLKGKIWVECEPDSGNAFHFTAEFICGCK